jgi:hypothetical protein
MSSYHSNGLTVHIVGIIASDRDCSCKDHPFCCEIVVLDIVVHVRCEMIHVAGGANGEPGREETAIVAYWVTNGIDACCIGFLPWYMNHHAARNDGVLGQTTATFSGTHLNYAIHKKWHRNMGFCRVVIISPLNGNALVVKMAGGSVAALGKGVPAELMQLRPQRNFVWWDLCPSRLHSSYFHHWRPMVESPHLRDGVF